MTIAEQTITDLVAVNDPAIVQSPGWWQKLKDAINDLILNDFSKLVQLLYQADVPEDKLKILLKQNTGTDAAEIIAGLLLERQLQKIGSRKKFSTGPAKGDEAERW